MVKLWQGISINGFQSLPKDFSLLQVLHDKRRSNYESRSWGSIP